MNQPTYLEATRKMQADYDKIIGLQADHLILHGCLGTCKQAKDTDAMLEYYAIQLMRIKLSYAKVDAANHEVDKANELVAAVNASILVA